MKNAHQGASSGEARVEKGAHNLVIISEERDEVHVAQILVHHLTGFWPE